MKAQSVEMRNSATHVASGELSERVKENVIMEEVEEEDAATKEEENLEECRKEEEKLEEIREEKEKLEMIREERTNSDKHVQVEENEKPVERENEEESTKEERSEHDTSADGSEPATEEKAIHAVASSRLTFKERLASRLGVKVASTMGRSLTGGNSYLFNKDRLAASTTSGHRMRGSRVFAAGSGATITAGSHQSLNLPVPSSASGNQIKSGVSKRAEVFISPSGQQVKMDQFLGRGGRKDSGNIMGGDWNKVISKRRGATCSVEVIQKLKQSEMSIERKQEERELCTGSSFVGQVDPIGMEGDCSYTMPHGVIYEGAMLDGRFDSFGTLAYPNKGRVEGFFTHGKLVPSTYTFPDGLVYELTDWAYCSSKTPDRRFQQEIKCGLRPVCTSLKTQQQPTRTIPEGCYDTGDGFYNPKTRCVTSATTGNIIRIPTKSEAKWIAKNCRKAWDEPSGFRPSLNENFRLDEVNYAPLLLANRQRRSMMQRKESSEVEI